jgi:hypothetical protein
MAPPLSRAGTKWWTSGRLPENNPSSCGQADFGVGENENKAALLKRDIALMIFKYIFKKTKKTEPKLRFIILNPREEVRDSGLNQAITDEHTDTALTLHLQN